MLRHRIKTHSGSAGRARRSRRSGFSLIELLVVIAITTVLLTLLFGPLLTGFRLTNQAQTTTQAQDAARVAMEQISREIGSAAAVRDTTHNYLNLREYTKSSTGQADEQIAHAYGAYIDIIPPRVSASNGTNANYVADPTVNPGAPIFKLQNGGLVSGATGLPIAPGTTLVRYFVALRRPINTDYTPANGTAVEQPYINMDEHQTFASGATGPTTGIAWGGTQVVTQGLDNTYILYRAEVSPYKKSANGGYVVNGDYFATDSGTQQPMLDDPDFFRVTNDAAHNARVYHWVQAAKPIIEVGNVNLIFQPHNGKGDVVYDSNGYLAGTTFESDNATPIIRTSVSFGPATVSDDPMHATASADISQGYGNAPSDTPSQAYIPTQYKAQFGQWSGNKTVVIGDANANTFATYVYHPAPGATIPAGYNDGDLIESLSSNAAKPDVFNVSTGSILNIAGNYPYVAMSVGGDDGTVNFAIPDTPKMTNSSGAVTSVSAVTTVDAQMGDADPSNLANPYWFVTFQPAATALEIHLQTQPSGPNDPFLLPNPAADGTNNVRPNIATTSSNGRVVINSERVYGPEQDAGPGSATPTAAATGNPATWPLVPYHRITFNPGGTSNIGADEYMIDYDRGIIYLGTTTNNIKVANNDVSPYPQSRTVLVAYSFQDNDVISKNSNGQITGEVADTVRATYQTSSRVEVSIGVRLYDPQTSLPTYFNLTNAVAVGNSGR